MTPTLNSAKVYWFALFLNLLGFFLNASTLATETHSNSQATNLSQLSNEIVHHPELNIHSILITKNDRLIYEKYFSGKDESWGKPLGVVHFDAEKLHDLRSITKSLVGTLIGIALHEGHIKNLDQKVTEFFPNVKLSDSWSKVTIRHLLTMSAGIEWIEDVPYNDPANDEGIFIRSGGDIGTVFSKKFLAQPGKEFLYNGGLTEILGRIITRATGKPIENYFEEKLLTPLQIDRKNYQWIGSKDLPSAASGLRLRPADLHKIASLFIHDGKFQDFQVIQEDWIREATQSKISVPESAMGGGYQAYGYQWWIPAFLGEGSASAFVGHGNGGQFLLIIPKSKIIVQILAGNYNRRSSVNSDLLEKWIFPALGLKYKTLSPLNKK